MTENGQPLEKISIQQDERTYEQIEIESSNDCFLQYPSLILTQRKKEEEEGRGRSHQKLTSNISSNSEMEKCRDWGGMYTKEYNIAIMQYC